MADAGIAVLVTDDGRKAVIVFDPHQPRDPETGQWWRFGFGAGKMRTLKWVDPPPPQGKGEQKAGGYSADKAAGTNTELGKRGEAAMVGLLGGRILHPEGKGQQSPLDAQINGYGVEIKTVSVQSTNYKASPKPYEIAEKQAMADGMGVKSALAIVVMDEESGKAYVYWREGLATGRLSKRKGWRFAGIATVPEEIGALAYDEGQERWPPGSGRKSGRWRKVGVGVGLPSIERSIPAEKEAIFLDPYHTSPEKAASPKFKPLPKPEASPQREGESDKDYADRAKKERQAEARTKLGEAPAYLAPQIEGMIRPLREGETVRLPEGTLIECRGSGDGLHYRIDGPDGTFWRVPPAEAARLCEFEEGTARANRFGETMPGNPMVPLEGVDVPSEDPIEEGVGGVLHGGYWPLPRGTWIHRKPGKHGDTFVLTSPTGVVAKLPATDKDAIIKQAREFEKQAEGRIGGREGDEGGPTKTAADPDGPLQPLSPRYNQTRIIMHAEAERVLGYEHGGNEVAIVRTPGGFGTPTYIETDGKVSRFRVDGTDTVFEQHGEEVTRDPISLPSPDPEAARQLADVFKLGDKVLRDMMREGVIPYPTIAGRFNSPIIWPEHFDMAVEIGIGDEHRANYGVSPGDENHPEPYFYVGPWEKKEPSDLWNGTGFNGAILPYSEVLASDDQEKTIRDFYLRHMEALGARKSASEREAGELSPKEALEAYKNGWGAIANNKLRGVARRAVGLTPDRKRMTPEQTDARVDRMIPALDREIADGKPISRTVYRGIDLSTSPGLKEHLHKGGTYVDPGFVSTTDVAEIAHNFTFNAKGGDPIVLNVHLPEGGTHAMQVSGTEAEHVLARGGTFTATSDPYDTSYFGIGVRVIDVDWRPAEP